MARRIEHYEGEILNSIGSIFIKDVDTPKCKTGRFALIECGICHKPHIQRLCNVINGNSACNECKHDRNVKELYRARANHYSYGDILNKETGSVFVVEIPHNGYAKRRAIVQCGRCKRLYEAPIANVVNGSYCSKCSSPNNSNASKKIEQILIDNNISYKREYSFKDLVGDTNRRLRFDFAVFFDSGYILLIEIDGKQHFEPVEYWGGEEYFKRLQNNDNKKNNYVNEHNNLFLVRISYKEFDDITEEYILSLYYKYNNLIGGE